MYYNSGYPQKGVGYSDLGQMLKDGIRNVFSSGFLTIAGFVLLMASLLSIISCMLPFWFILTLYNQKFDDELVPNNITIDSGLFFMDAHEYISLLAIDKATSVQLMPDFLHWAQFLFLVGTIGILVCTASAILLMFRDKTVVSAEMALTGATTALALCQAFGVLFCLFQWLFDKQARWQDLPVRDAIPNRFGFYKVLEAYPVLELNWGFFFGAISAVFCVVAAVLLWLQMCSSCVRLSNRRYEMLREKPDVGSSPVVGYQYYANKSYMQHPGNFGTPEVRPLIYTERPPAATEVDL